MPQRFHVLGLVPAIGMVARVLGAQAVPAFAAYQVDFSVPDAPAYVLVQADPSAILRPQTVRELAVALSGFRTPDGSLSLPRAAAIEFSPGLLITNGRLTAASYSARKLLFSTRVSLATRRDSTTGAPTRLALGLRLSLANEADFKTDTGYPPELGVTDLTKRILDIYNAAPLLKPNERPGPENPRVPTAEQQSQIERFEREIRERWAIRYWNADILDVAIALGAQAVDSTGRDPKLHAFSLWASYAKGLGRWGQALFGIRMGTARDSAGVPYRQSANLAARVYAGSNRGKAFAEVQQSWTENASTEWLLNSGLELRVAKGIWVVFSLGIEQPGGASPRSVAAFKLNTGLPTP